MRTKDIRAFDAPINTDARVICGYTAVYNSESHDLGGFVEILAPGCFTKTLVANPDIRCLMNHDSSKCLGRTVSGTLELREDPEGLWFSVTLPDTTFANDLVVSYARGDIWQCSFGFYVVKGQEEWVDRGPSMLPLRVVHEVILEECSAGVCFPAYENAVSTLRSLDTFRTTRDRRIKAIRSQIQILELS